MDYESNISVREDAPINQIIIQITATDADNGKYGRITYLLDNKSSS